jgi:peroxiredoxin/uncharacterized membrane protein YphA (DoxX/SURF4 family)
MSGLVLGIRILLAAVFVVAGIAKLADRDGSRRALEGFGVPSRFARVGSVVLPLVEVAIAAGLLVGATARWGLTAATGLLAAFVLAIGVTMARGATPDCHCFGELHSAPAGWRTLSRTAVLAALGATAVALGPPASHLSPFGWIGWLNAAELVTIAVGVSLTIVILVQGWFLLELLRQHGRILNRLEGLEQAFADAGHLARAHAGSASVAGVVAGNGNGHVRGLAVGVPAPEFELPRLDGPAVSLSALRARGAPVLLIFSDPGCRPCNALLPDIAQWQRRLSDRLTIALISRGGVKRNLPKAREFGLRDVLVQHERDVASQYHAHGTPSAVLITTDGRIASSLSGGAPAITALVQNLTPAPLNVIRSLANGSPHGAPTPSAAAATLPVRAEAPDLTWEDLDGQPISLRALRGAPAVVVFWNPRCGFCQRLLPELRAWEAQRDPDAPHLIVISTGDQESNRAMGLRSPIALEQGFQSGHAFGATGTPSAIRIDPTGRIATTTAVGAPAVLELLQGPEREPANRPTESEAHHALRT